MTTMETTKTAQTATNKELSGLAQITETTEMTGCKPRVPQTTGFERPEKSHRLRIAKCKSQSLLLQVSQKNRSGCGPRTSAQGVRSLFFTFSSVLPRPSVTFFCPVLLPNSFCQTPRAAGRTPEFLGMKVFELKDRRSVLGVRF